MRNKIIYTHNCEQPLRGLLPVIMFIRKEIFVKPSEFFIGEVHGGPVSESWVANSSGLL